jgi:hypothetical protein
MKSILKRIVGVILFGALSFGSQISFATAPAQPTGVSVTSASPSGTLLGAARATVSWTTVSGAIAYQISATPLVGGPSIPGELTGFDVSSKSLSTTLVGLLGGVAYNFVVTAVNVTGERNGSTAVVFTPQSVPDAPAGLSATAGVAQASLTWAAPTNTGGLPITSYVVSTIESPATTYSEPASATSANISGLQSGSSYTFQIAAINSLGTSSYLQAVKITTPNLPGAPTSVAGVVTADSATIKWAAPTVTGNSLINSYSVRIYDSTGADQAALDKQSPTTSVTISAIPTGSYTAKVSASNAVGPGPLSSASQTFVVLAASTQSANSPAFTPLHINDQNIGALIAINATAPSGGTVSISASPSTVCTYSNGTGSLTTIAPGVCTVVATVSSNSTFAAGAATLTFNVLKLSQTLTFDSIGPQTLPGSVSLHAQSSSSGVVIFTATGNCSVVGTTLTLISAGSCSVTANAPATDSYNAATPSTQTFTIAQAVVQSSGGSSGSSGGGNSGYTGNSGGGGGSSGSTNISAQTSNSVAPVVVPTPTPVPTPTQSATPSTPSTGSTKPTPSPTPTSAAPINPPTTTPQVKTPTTKVVATGITVSTAGVAGPVVTKTVAKPALSSTAALLVPVVTGATVEAKVSSLPKSQSLAVTIQVAGKWVSLGNVKSSSSGTLVLPGLKFAKPGTYLIAMKRAHGSTYYLKYVVSAKK